MKRERERGGGGGGPGVGGGERARGGHMRTPVKNDQETEVERRFLPGGKGQRKPERGGSADKQALPSRRWMGGGDCRGGGDAETRLRDNISGGTLG